MNAKTSPDVVTSLQGPAGSGMIVLGLCCYHPIPSLALPGWWQGTPDKMGGLNSLCRDTVSIKRKWDFHFSLMLLKTLTAAAAAAWCVKQSQIILACQAISQQRCCVDLMLCRFDKLFGW